MMNKKDDFCKHRCSRRRERINTNPKSTSYFETTKCATCTVDEYLIYCGEDNDGW